MNSARRIFVSLLVPLAASLANADSTGPKPAAPQVTVGADIKQLTFDWDPVARATYYRVLVKIGSAAYQPVVDNIAAADTRAVVALSVHLQRWATTRYVIAACNAAGCTNSAAILPRNLMLDTIGYFKASNTDAHDDFGRNMVLSDDGRTLVVSAGGEASNAAGVNGNQADNSSLLSGAVYVFRRAAGGWRQEAYLKAGVNQREQQFGFGYPFGQRSVAVNKDGSLVAVGAPRQNVGALTEAGAVYVYQRSSSGRWSLAATLNSPTPLVRDFFGMSVDMSLDGRTLKVTTLQPQDGEGNGEVRTHIFVRPATTWQHSATIAPPFPGDFCQSVRLSGDGNTLLSACFSYLGRPSYLVTHKRSANTWTEISQTPMPGFSSQGPMAFNADATLFAHPEGAVNHTVVVYRWDGATWLREKQFNAPPSPDPNGSPAFGETLAFNRAGTLLAIGDIVSTQAGAGVMDAVSDGGVPHGAVYLWQRAAGTTPSWTLRSVVKAPDPVEGDVFGLQIAMCGTGKTLAVSAVGEDSGATGVDGDRTDVSATESGAVYLY